MKVFRLYGSKDEDKTFSFQGLKTLRRDGMSRNDLQTTMAVIQWLTIITEVLPDCWLWDDGTPLLWDDGTLIF